jgi:hypothetical protein
MHLTSSPNTSASLDNKSNPSLPALVSECIFGSPRREALGALRTARPNQWDYTADPVQQIRVQDEQGRDLLFQYKGNRPYNGAHKLHALHLTSERGSLHLDGTCELAQRVNRFAARAFGALLQNEAKACLHQLKEFIAGRLEAPSSFERKESHRHLGQDRFNNLSDSFATIKLPSGDLKIHWHKHQFHLSMEERIAKYEILMRCFMELYPPPHIPQQVPEPTFSGAGYTVGSFSSSVYKPVPPPFPPSYNVEESISAVLSQPKLDTIADCLGVTSLKERFTNLGSMFSNRKEDLLFTALRLAEKLEKKG